MSYFDSLPKEIIFMIINLIPSWNALSLRQTCHILNENVIQNQVYWYRQFTLYLIKQNKRVALFKTGCKRKHKSDVPLTVNCLSSKQEADLADELSLSITKLPDYLEQQNVEVSITVADCQNPLHFVYEVPRILADIPIVSADFHPTEQIYLYRYLIHNYRTRRDKVKRYNSDMIKVQKRETVGSLKRAEAAVEKHRKKLETLSNIATQLKMIEKNKVFFNSKSRQYRGLDN